MAYVHRITDEFGTLGFGEGATVEAELFCTIDLGSDSYPPEEPAARLDAISVLRVFDPQGESVVLTSEQEDAVVKFVDEETGRNWGEVELKVFSEEQE